MNSSIYSKKKGKIEIAAKRSGNRKEKKDIFKRVYNNRYLYFLLIPIFAFYIVFKYAPMYGTIIAFKDFRFADGILGSKWVGLAHFRRLFTSPDFLAILRNTLLLNLYSIVFSFSGIWQSAGWGTILYLAAITGIDQQLYEASLVDGANKLRQDWLDKLNLKMPATEEELMAVAKAFKEKDPDGNGKDDTYGFAFNGNRQALYAMYKASPGMWYLEDGKLKYALTLDRYADAMALYKKMFDEGLVDREYITDTNFQRQRQFWVTGKAGIYISSYNIENEYKDLKKNLPDAKIVLLESVAAKYGKNGLWQEAPANQLAVFNAKAKNPKVAMR